MRVTIEMLWFQLNFKSGKSLQNERWELKIFEQRGQNDVKCVFTLLKEINWPKAWQYS